MKAIDRFLIENNHKFRAGGKCQTCKVSNLKQLNDAVRRFIELRKNGKTDIPFVTFVERCVKPQLGYKMNAGSLRRHVENCLGEKVP